MKDILAGARNKDLAANEREMKTFETQRDEAATKKPLKHRGTEGTEDFGVVRRGQDRRETGRF
jgi:hypothetical protein